MPASSNVLVASPLTSNDNVDSETRQPGGGGAGAASPAGGALAPAALHQDNLPVGYLRAFITLLVVAHHAVLAYVPMIPPPGASLRAVPRLWEAFPVVDRVRWESIGIFTSFNDVFFMSLMFFLSGLFVWSSLRRKGGGGFFASRALRLGVPFLVAAGVVAPLAYSAAYVMTGAGGGMRGFAREWLALGEWPAGPAWFLWVLLVFDALAAVLFAMAPAAGERVGRWMAGARRRPVLWFAALVVVSAAAYLPLAFRFGPMMWSSFGPFYFQTSRILHYAVYFFAGLAVGAGGLGGGLLAEDGALARRWPLWVAAAVTAFVAAGAVTIMAFAPHAAPVLGTLSALSFVVSCACSCLAFLAVFVRFARRRRALYDSCRANAYGIYVLHYAFVAWVQLALLQLVLPAPVKGVAAIVAAVTLAWTATAALRRIPAVARFI